MMQESSSYEGFGIRMANFDEKSGIVPCKTPWGRWWQTVDEVQIEIESPDTLTTSKEVKCIITNKTVSCHIKGKRIFEGSLFRAVKADDSTWTLEDKRMVRVLLAKANPSAANCWQSLLAATPAPGGEGDVYAPDPFTLDQMKQKMTLQRFQHEVDAGLRSLDHDDDDLDAEDAAEYLRSDFD